MEIQRREENNVYLMFGLSDRDQVASFCLGVQFDKSVGSFRQVREGMYIWVPLGKLEPCYTTYT